MDKERVSYKLFQNALIIKPTFSDDMKFPQHANIDPIKLHANYLSVTVM